MEKIQESCFSGLRRYNLSTFYHKIVGSIEHKTISRYPKIKRKDQTVNYLESRNAPRWNSRLWGLSSVILRGEPRTASVVVPGQLRTEK